MLTISKLHKSFPLRAEPVLDGINLSLEPGEFCVLIGSNGSGKSTLLKTILGEHRPDSGEIYLRESKISNMPLHDRTALISSVVQDISKGTIGEMTLLENMVLSYLRGKSPTSKFYDIYAHKMHQIIAELKIGLEKYLHHKIASLSGGQRQIIATLMAMLSDIRLLLLDEHTSALDPRTGRLLMEYTSNKIRSSNITTLMVTHNFQDAVDYGDRVIMLHHGKIAFDIKGHAKNMLTKEHLMNMFHRIEDGMGY